MGWSITVAATGTTRGSAAMMREAISGLLLGNLRGGFAFYQKLWCFPLLMSPWSRARARGAAAAWNQFSNALHRTSGHRRRGDES